MRLRIFLTAASLLASLSAAISPAQAATMPVGARIFTGASVARMLHQCSRPAPETGEANWTPRAADIIALETALPAALKAEQRSRDWSAFPQDFMRQYVGIVRKGRRYVYGNFAPRHGGGPATDKPIIVCDGGASFFGAEYDVGARKISHLAFNGRP
jgi:predicted secreted protein